MEGLLRLGDISAVSLAGDLARHPDPSVRAAVAHALAATSDKQAVAILETLLQDQQPHPRLLAAKALGMSGAPVTPLLKKVCKTQMSPCALLRQEVCSNNSAVLQRSLTAHGKQFRHSRTSIICMSGIRAEHSRRMLKKDRPARPQAN